MDDARRSSENLYNDARTAVSGSKEEAKAGWFSWLGWGKSKKEEAKGEAKNVKDKL